MSGLMSLGTRAMFASYAALQTTGNNIANANTPGYSRQQVDLATAGGQFTGAGFFGKGVNVETVSRVADAFLTKESQLAASQAAGALTKLEQLQRLEKVFASGENGIGFAAGNLLNAFTDVANKPTDTSARQVVLARAEELASRFRSANEQIDSLQAGVVSDMKNSVATVNALAQKVAQINQQIAAVQGIGHVPNDLLDQRDQLVTEINQYIQVTTIPADDGTLGLFIGGGQRLVLSNQALQLAVVPDEFDPARVQLALKESGGTRIVPADQIAGGSISALMSFQNEDLADARTLVGQLASAIAGRLNQQQALGLDLRQPAGAGAPIFSLGAPRVLPAQNNSAAALNSVSITISDATQLQASDYELKGDPSTPGQYILTRLSDGTTRTVVPGDTVDGFTIGVGIPAPGANDRYLLQPVAMAASSMQRVLDDPKGIAAASAVSATVGAANTGTATVGSLRTVSASLDPTLTAAISFTDNSGNYSWSLTDAGGTVVGSGTGSWSAGTPIALNGFELSLNGVPRSGDTIQVAATQFPEANNGNALALLDLRDEGLVGRQILGSGAVVPGETITDAYARAMADVGVRVQGANAASKISTAVAENAKEVLTSKVGVNLDEEAARLIQYQQGYQAAAKVLQVAQTIFDTLLQAAA
ncbi:flagellar hook-associated protein FlgK [Caldimonas sp. KR1-144]|uniref:flagellar hook-associated protein FlgK n=1 Tax=Caldimonas sp. KR1-144 TaxID=3400911 RepID=UPI003C0344F2